MQRNDTRKAFETIKSMGKKMYTPRLKVIKDETGNTLTETEDILNRWKEYCEKMYEKEDDNEETIAGITSEMRNYEDADLEPMRSEVEAAIKKLKDGKSPGCDNLPAELIKAGGDGSVDVYHALCTKIWRTKTWPKDWKRAVFLPLPKKGDLQLCSNYRTISLISHASKIMLMVLMTRMRSKLENEVSRCQAGFRSGRGTRDHIFNLQQLIRKCIEVQHELRISFIDYSKAFDCVKHEHLWRTLEDLGFGGHLIELIKSLYVGQESAVRIEGGISKWFEVQRGVRQGCILSPYLFNAYTEKIMRDVMSDERSDKFDGLKINGEVVADLRYADDTALLSDSKDGLETLLQTVKDYSDEKGLKLNVKKTKIMDIKGSGAPSDVKIDGEAVERVESFEYLGAKITNDGDCVNEVKRRLAIASRKLVATEGLWSGTCNEIKLKLLNTCIFSVALYGCEAWTVSKNIANRLEGFANKCYRKLLNVKWTEKRTNESIHAELKVKPGLLMRMVKSRKLRYFGHLKRHESLEKVILEGKVSGKRGVGHPRRKWTDDVADWLGVDIAAAGMLALNRGKFRTAVRAATSHPG